MVELRLQTIRVLLSLYLMYVRTLCYMAVTSAATDARLYVDVDIHESTEYRTTSIKRTNDGILTRGKSVQKWIFLNQISSSVVEKRLIFLHRAVCVDEQIDLERLRSVFLQKQCARSILYKQKKSAHDAVCPVVDDYILKMRKRNVYKVSSV